ncbi:protein TIC 62, chloroplastic-like isoform X2 [Coffea arabica]|uniref:Protein TIC 62, chloroplastic-like isoform X2 n=1 Tax=Coffea arabica TaxID=13443 RepID=A0ABM4WG82_COFAR
MQLLRPPQSVTLTNDVALPCGLSTKRPLFLRGQVAKLGSSNIVRCPDGHGQTLKPIHVRIRPHASVAVKVSVKTAESAPSDVVLKDGNLIFVAGATGRVGSRTVRELLKSGSRVRAGVRSAQRAESLVQSVQQMKFDAAETGLTPPTIAQVDHFILLTSLGTNKVGFPAAILNLFWGVLIWKRKAEEALLASGLPYTIVRPGGMERPTDAFKETHNITVSQEDTLFGGLVSNLQVAELMAFMAKNRSLSYCKVVEVIAETTAPLTPMGELLAKIPSQRAEVFSPGKLDDAVGPGTAATEIATSGTPRTTVEKETVQPKAAEKTPLSPYTAYEDLKPPSSPSPSPSGPKEVHASNDILSELTGGNDVGTINIGEENYPQKVASRHSPYLVYPDLKPPSSPSPNAPVSSTSNEMLPSIADKLGN